VRLKLVNENWEIYSEVQDELEKIGHDKKSQQQHDEMEESIVFYRIYRNKNERTGTEKGS